MNLNDMAFECNELSRSKGWLDLGRTFGDEISLIHSEASEALEEFRDGHDFNEVYFRCDICKVAIYTEEEWLADDVLDPKTPCCGGEYKPEGIGIEYADILIRVLQSCGDHKIDIQRFFSIKMDYNQTRPALHGGKKL